MSIRKALKWTLPPLALLALAAWLPSAPPVLPAALPPPAAAAAQDRAAPGPAAPQAPQKLAGPDRALAVARIVREKNDEAARDREAFTQAGWTFVDAPPPDQKLVRFEPSLLNGREPELRQQLLSTSAAPSDAPNLGRIAEQAREPETAVAAVEALGRINGAEAQAELTRLLRDLPPDSPARHEVAPLIRPRDLHEPHAEVVAGLLDSPKITEVERKQLAFTLALIALRDRTELSPTVLAGLSPSSRELLAQMISLASLRSTP